MSVDFGVRTLNLCENLTMLPSSVYRLSPVMHYYSGKLFWQGGRKDIIVLDIRGNSLAKLLVATSGDIETFTLTHSSLYWLPGTLLRSLASV